MNDKFKRFLKDSKYQNMGPTDQSLGKPQPPLFGKLEGQRIPLPKMDGFDAPDGSLNEAISQRKSYRKFVRKPIAIEELSYALWSTQGVKKVVEGRATFRTVPSAGARHAFDTFVLINYMDELESGLYFFDALEHALVFVAGYDTVKDKILAGCLNQRMVIEASVCFFWVADIYRMAYRYGERGFRYLLLDAGHIAQNLYLIAETMQAGTCAIGAFDDDLLNDALNLDKEAYAVLYVGPLGKRPYEG